MNIKHKNDNTLLHMTLIIVALMLICSITGIAYEKLYSRETSDWLSQTVGQDISNVFFVAPILLISAILASHGNRTAKILWIGAMITNVYSYIIYSFAVHFNFLFHVYCIILGLSIYSVIIFFIKNFNVDFKTWFKENSPTKAVGILLFIIAFIFTFLWLSSSLPAALKNTVPADVTKDALLTNPVQALDFSFYLPLMYISSVMIIRKKSIGYILAPMMLVFAIFTNINIICLMFVGMQKGLSDNTSTIIGFSIFTVICLVFLCIFLRNTSRDEKISRSV